MFKYNIIVWAVSCSSITLLFGQCRVREQRYYLDSVVFEYNVIIWTVSCSSITLLFGQCRNDDGNDDDELF